MSMCSFLVCKNACLKYREFDLEGNLVGVPYTWHLSAQSFIRVLKLVWREYDIVAMNEWKKKCVGLHRTWVSKRTVRWPCARLDCNSQPFSPKAVAIACCLSTFSFTTICRIFTDHQTRLIYSIENPIHRSPLTDYETPALIIVLPKMSVRKFSVFIEPVQTFVNYICVLNAPAIVPKYISIPQGMEARNLP